MNRLRLDAPIPEIDRRLAERRTGGRTKGPPAYQVLAEGLGILTVGQLLRHYPRRYVDRSRTESVRDLRRALGGSAPTLTGENAGVRLGDQVTVIGHVGRVDSRRTRRGQTMVTVVLDDGTGRLELPFFNQPWVARQYRPGDEVAVSGRLGVYRGRVQLGNQEVEVLRGGGSGEADGVHTGRIIPVHRATEGVTPRTIRELVHRAIGRLGPIPEALPAGVLAGEDLAPEDTALRAIHFPADAAALRRARDRLKFDELLVLELGVAYRKRRLERASDGVAQAPGDLSEGFLRSLPFEPTAAQRRAMKEIAADMTAPHPMNRLLEGDVGSGKTAVAVHAALIAVGSGHQAAIMAPTEVLAGQHLRSVAAMLEPLGGRDVAAAAGPAREEVAGQQSLLGPPEGEELAGQRLAYAFLTASVTGGARERVMLAVREGTADLVIGTHALVQEGVEFADLSLVVVDEQHRFGVRQRASLKEKGGRSGRQPDVLIMTATPIPRTLALTYYGDLDVSVLDEMPAGRRPVRTMVARSEQERDGAYDLVRREVGAGRQAFVVCAAIDEANRKEVRAAEAEARRLREQVFPDLSIGLLHGRMRPAEKEATMQEFRSGRLDVLISTTVVEVGVDVPNATVMLVENADRFGLAQLHQLRGRIGRGRHDSTCVLFDESGPDGEEARARLSAMRRTADGFELADEDLRLRGEGTLFDARQSGMPDLKLARLARDAPLVARARRRAFAVVDADPELEAHPELMSLLRESFSAEAIDWLFRG